MEFDRPEVGVFIYLFIFSRRTNFFPSLEVDSNCKRTIKIVNNIGKTRGAYFRSSSRNNRLTRTRGTTSSHPTRPSFFTTAVISGPQTLPKLARGPPRAPPRLPFDFFYRGNLFAWSLFRERAHKSGNKSTRRIVSNRSKMDDCYGGGPAHQGWERGGKMPAAKKTFITNPPLPPTRGCWKRIQPRSNAQTTLFPRFSTVSHWASNGFSHACCNTSPEIGEGGGWYFEGNFERFGNEQIPTIESSRSTDREENQRAAFDGGGGATGNTLVRLVTTSVLHKYFNRRLFRVLPIPCDFR